MNDYYMNENYYIDEYETQDMKFIWGIKSYDDLTSLDANIHSLNYIDLIYHKDENKYSLNIETIYLFDEEEHKLGYLKSLLEDFTKFMKENNYNTEKKPFWMDVFSFGISTAPKSVKKLADHFGFDYQESDYYVFHQANMKMNKMIQKKLKLDDEKVPYSLHDFGNTSSASIPITIVTQLKNQLKDKSTKFICCGFGVGLSWGSVRFTTDEHLVISELVEVNNDQIDTIHVV